MFSYLSKRLCTVGYTFRINQKTELHQWTSHRVRESFISFYKNNDHVYIPSSPVIPWNDTSIEFVNAGMNQFKSTLLGHRPFPTLQGLPAYRIANSQKCIRVGGKHNDLSDVGRDTYHHTFFEMLGNWSFNNYFKKEACQMSWELLTTVFKIPHQHLYVTYFGGDKLEGIEEDEEVKNIWLSIGVPEERIIPFGMKDNFWEMGDIGPCGVSTEIHFEREPSLNGASKVNTNCEDVIEIWNLVFIQYQRLANGELVSLSNNFVDTGMGLERITACLNGKKSNYDTDLFMPLFDQITKISNMPSYKGTFNSEDQNLDKFYRILADHSRMIAISLADGLLPQDSNVLRNLIKKCILIGWEKFGLGNKHNFMETLLQVVANNLGDVYPELNSNFHKMKAVLDFEDKHLREVRSQLSKDLPKLIELYPKLLRVTNTSPNLVTALEEFILPNITNWTTDFAAEDAFKLVDKYALSEGAIEEVVEALNLNLNWEQFHSLIENFKASGTLHPNEVIISLLKNKNIPDTIDLRYNYKYLPDKGYNYISESSQIQSIIFENNLLNEIVQGQSASLVLSSTHFYPKSGGQCSDNGFIECNSNKFKVISVEKIGNYIIHHGNVVNGSFQIENNVKLDFNKGMRVSASKLHTAHHLLRAAIEAITGMAYQRSSKVTGNDLSMILFVHPQLNVHQLMQAESIVKSWINQNQQVSKTTLHLFDALRLPNLTLLSGEKYPEDVHVISTECDLFKDLQISNHHDSPITKVKSSELCCGTHIFNTGHLEDFAISELKFHSNGTSQIVAVCGKDAKILNKNGEVLLTEFKEWENKIVTAIKNNEKLKFLFNDFKKWKSEIKKSQMPATVFYFVDERCNELMEQLKEIVISKSNWKELHEEFIAHLAANFVGPICYEMKTDYRGSLDDLVTIIKEVSGRPAVFVCKGWGRVRACVFIPQELQDKDINIAAILNDIQDKIGKDKSEIKFESNEIGIFHMNGVKRDQLHSIKSIILKTCEKSISKIVV